MSIAHAEPDARMEAEEAFRNQHPAYSDTAVLDELRRTDLARLDRGGQWTLLKPSRSA